MSKNIKNHADKIKFDEIIELENRPEDQTGNQKMKLTRVCYKNDQKDLIFIERWKINMNFDYLQIDWHLAQGVYEMQGIPKNG